jgi:hypothetical protein
MKLSHEYDSTLERRFKEAPVADAVWMYLVSLMAKTELVGVVERIVRKSGLFDNDSDEDIHNYCISYINSVKQRQQLIDEGKHVEPSPLAGKTAHFIATGRAVSVLDWFDRKHPQQRSASECLHGLLMRSYFERCEGMQPHETPPYDNDMLVVLMENSPAVVHVSELYDVPSD